MYTYMNVNTHTHTRGGKERGREGIILMFSYLEPFFTLKVYPRVFWNLHLAKGHLKHNMAIAEHLSPIGCLFTHQLQHSALCQLG